MARDNGWLWLGVVAAISLASACDERVSIGERDAAMGGDGGSLDAGAAVDASTARDLAVVDTDAGTGTDAAIGVGLAHLEIELVTVARDTSPSAPESRYSLIVRGFDRAPGPSTPVAAVETFGLCRVSGSEIPSTPPGSIDLGEGNVEYEVGSSGRQPMIRYERDGEVSYSTGSLSPMPAPGTIVHAYVTLAGHTFEASTVVSTLALTSPMLIARPFDYQIAYTAGEDLVARWTPTSAPEVRLTNLRYDASGVGPSTYMACVGDAATTSFTIPARIVATYLQNARGASTDSVLVLYTFEREVTTDSGITVGVSHLIRGREGVCPHG
jgi:hypothetical protein